jgi:hypothetical protein
VYVYTFVATKEKPVIYQSRRRLQTHRVIDPERRQGGAAGVAEPRWNDWEINRGLTMKLIDRWQHRCALGLGLLLLAAGARRS